jgi:hypothetical protein
MRFSVLLLLILILTGCTNADKPKDLPKLYPCTITVTQEQQPLAEASVFITPAEWNKWNAGGTTDSSGKAVLYTHGKYNGVPAGTYKVTVNKYEIGPEKPNGEAILARTGNFPEPDSFSLVDLQYTNENKTPLEITISKEERTFSLDLGKAVKVLKR